MKAEVAPPFGLWEKVVAVSCRAGINSGIKLSASERNSEQDAVPEGAWKPPSAGCTADTWGGNGNGGTEIADGTAWPRRPEEVLMAYASELGMDVRVLWLHGFVLWIENEPILDEQAQADVRAALRRLEPEVAP